MLKYLNNAYCNDLSCLQLFKGTAFTERDHFFFHTQQTYHSKYIEEFINCVYYAQQTFSLDDYKTILKHLTQQGTLNNPVCNYSDISSSSTSDVLSRVCKNLNSVTLSYNHTAGGLLPSPLPVKRVNDYITAVTTGVPLLVAYVVLTNLYSKHDKHISTFSNLHKLPKEFYPAILANPDFNDDSPLGLELRRLKILPDTYWGGFF